METILVTELEFAKAAEVFRDAQGVRCEPAAADETGLARAVAAHGARAVIVGVAPYRGPLYEALGRNGPALLARFGVGHDNIDKTLARQHGIVVTNTPGALDSSVAEHTLWLMGCLARKVVRAETRLRGAVAAERLIQRAAIRGHTHDHRPCAVCGDGPSQSDFLSVHLPVVPSTLRFVNAARLAWLKPGALLINTARGAVLDEEALYDALASGRLAGAALDVFVREPYVPADPGKDLRTLENVVLTPHIGSNTREANQRMAVASLQNVRDFLAGRPERLTRVDQLVPGSSSCP
jgi:lactate dehydrogenase-like 2-hydroxyacid dehydrogenase